MQAHTPNVLPLPLDVCVDDYLVLKVLPEVEHFEMLTLLLEVVLYGVVKVGLPDRRS